MEPKIPNTGTTQGDSPSDEGESSLFRSLLRPDRSAKPGGDNIEDAISQAMRIPIPAERDNKTPLSSKFNVTGMSKAQAWKSYVNQQLSSVTVALDVELPSGLSVKAIRPNIFVLLQQGRIPDAVTPIVDRMIADSMGDIRDAGNRFQKGVEQDFVQDPLQSFNKYKLLLDIVWIEAVVDPIFVRDINHLPIEVESKMVGMSDEEKAEFRDGILPLAGVAIDDQMYLFNWCQGVTEPIISFRERQDGLMANLPNLQRLRQMAM